MGGDTHYLGECMLDLNELEQGMPALTPACGKAMAEAAGVCLESQNHAWGVELQVIGGVRESYVLDWPKITDQTQRTWNDMQDATEDGATAIAILLSKNELGYSVIQRSRKGTGFDYWVGGDDANPLQRKARLEISGILRSRVNAVREIKARVNQKLRQTERTKSSLPTYVIVVEFGRPIAEVKQYEQS